MKRVFLPLLTILLVLLVAADKAAAQAGGGHTLYGDLTVAEGQASGDAKPRVFFVVLYTAYGQALGREPCSPNGRYRFSNVLNGEYDLVVEVDGQEAVRVRINVIDPRKTDIRRDLSLEWRAKAGSATTRLPEDYYKRQPENETLFAKAEEALKKTEYKEAVALLGRIVAAEPNDFVSWTELGTTYFKQGDAPEAEKAYLKAIEVRPSLMLALLNLGKVRMAQKNYEGAIEVLTKAVQQQSQSADANFFLGESYLQIKKGSKAVGYLNEALRLDPLGKAEAHLRLAALYKGAGMKDKAVAEYESFLAKKPDYPDRKALEQYILENKKSQR